ncbi:MAG: (2Fe-2S)-binding protein [Bryobacterales bacterium]|nr:(2Fe-2S)-binding protein [Bryobacterales bacterium]
MKELFEIRVNSKALLVDSQTTVAVAVVRAGVLSFRRSASGECRGPLCGVGICAECRATIDGVPDLYTCQHWCRPGMVVETEKCPCGKGA